jgi:hypothetical protein
MRWASRCSPVIDYANITQAYDRNLANGELHMLEADAHNMDVFLLVSRATRTPLEWYHVGLLLGRSGAGH